MVQQPFGPAPPQATTTLALPAIVAGQPQQQQQQAFSSLNQQADPFYNPQQQPLKTTASHQYNYQQPRLSNGIPNGLSSGQQQQQNSPNSQEPPASLYNRTGAPIYAPKPTYYPPAAVYAAGRSPMQASGFYQATAHPSQAQQQQPSPAAGLPRPQPTGLSVRQMPVPILSQPVSLSPQQQVGQSSTTQMIQQQALEQQQRQHQMQQLIMSYQQQQQLQNSILHNSSMQDQVVQQQQQQQQQQQLQQAAAAADLEPAWEVARPQQRHLYAQQPASLVQPSGQERLVGASLARHSTRFSDRDSISTVSRFNQFDERRSMTMRSQYTSAKQAANINKNFGFAEVTLVAVKRLLGLAPANEKPQNLSTNLQMSFASGHQSKQQNGSSFQSSSAAKVTVIDSAENHYFNRKVFSYQLIIMRCLCFLSAAFVLLSPVAMLLVPKMEHVFNDNGSRDYSTDSSSSQEDRAIPTITHALGLSNLAKQQRQATPYYTPQPQWRISECTSDCDGLLIGFVTRFIMLCIAYWAIFFRTQSSSLPRIDFQRCLLVSMAVLITLSYWLFFTFRLFDKRFNDFELQYLSIVQFSLSMLESLILLHYLAVILLEIRSRKKLYCLKVVRSPDGESRYLSCGAISIQKCAELVLEKYHRQFKQYGQYKEQLLGFEDRLARNLVASASSKQRSEQTERSSRPSSPANSHSGARSSRRPSSRSSRHRSRAERSASPSPSRKSSSQQRRSSTEINNRNKGVKVYQLDLDPAPGGSGQQRQQPEAMAERSSADQLLQDNQVNANVEVASNKLQQANDNKQDASENNSGDQSSDTTSKMKESSLETIRAANSTSDLITQQQQPTQSKTSKTPADNNDNKPQQRSLNSTRSQRDETESVRSGRSRRSTSRHHSRHRDRDRERDRDHHHHRERSSSRVAHENNDYDNHHHNHSTSVILPSNHLDPLEEHERKLRKRKFRLLVAVQDAFQQIKRTCEDQIQADGNSNGLQQQQQQQKQTPNQTARSLYPRIARSLQKYLRLTGQTGNHNLQSIYEHLSKCLLYKLSPRAFLEKFFNQDPVWQANETNLFANCTLQDSMLMCPRQKRDFLEINSWSLVCDTLLSRQIDSGTFFVLKQGQVSLLVSVARMPHLNLTEEVIDQSACRLTLNSMDA